MTWLDAAPALGAAVVVLWLPGLVVGAVAGVPDLLRWAIAPVASTAVVALAAVAAQLVGVRFGVVSVVAATLLAAALLLPFRWVARRAMGQDAGSRQTGSVDRRAIGSGLLGVAIGSGLLLLVMGHVAGRPDDWPQQYDAVFHLSAVDHIVDSGDGSALTLGTLTSPLRDQAFYPAAWHDLTALVAQVTGAPVTVAATAVAFVAASLVWAVGCVSLARVAVGPRPAVLLASGILAAGITAGPVLLNAYGTLWPNALATALLPGTIALAVDLLGLGQDRLAPPLPGWILLLGLVAGLGLAHPNAVVTVLVLAVPVVLVGTWSRGRRWRVGGVGLTVLVAYLVMYSPAFAAQRAVSWPVRQSIAQAGGEWLALAPQRMPIPYAVAALALVGGVAAWRTPRLRWLLALHLAAGALFVLIAGSDGALSRLVSAAWWDDPFRPAALVGIGGVPLAALGTDLLVRWSRLRAPRWARPVASFAGGLVGAAVLSVVASGAQMPGTVRALDDWWGPTELLRPQEEALLERLPTLVPRGERVAGNPWDGAALTGPLGDREAVFPHLSGVWDPDRQLLAQALSQARSRPDVCAALNRLDVHYVVTNAARFWTDDARRERYDGLDVNGIPGFEPVASGGAATLWRITACGP